MATSDGGISIARPAVANVHVTHWEFWRNDDGSIKQFRIDVQYLDADGGLISVERCVYVDQDAVDFATASLQATPVRKMLSTLKTKKQELANLTVA